MSHEIRTPLNSVLALSQLLRDGVAGALTRDQRRYLEVIERNGQNLLRLINDILDLSRIEAGHLEMDTADRRPRRRRSAPSAADAGAAGRRPRSLDLAVKLPDDLPAVRCDVDRLRQILTNLIGNAIKFTDDGAGAGGAPRPTATRWRVHGDRHRRRHPRGRQRQDLPGVLPGRPDAGAAPGRHGPGPGDREPPGAPDGRRDQRRERGRPRLAVHAQAAAGARPRPTRRDGARVPDAPAAERRVHGAPAATPPGGCKRASREAMAVSIVEDNEDNLFTLRQILAAAAARDGHRLQRARGDRDTAARGCPISSSWTCRCRACPGCRRPGAIRALPGGADIPISR